MKAWAVAGVAVAWLLVACDRPVSVQQPQDEQALLGRELLARYHCGSCHVIPGVAGAQGRLAASLQGYGRRSYIAGRVANEPGALAQWIVDPASIVPGTPMPNMGVGADDARAMALYLGRLQ
jgi:cytochrome c